MKRSFGQGVALAGLLLLGTQAMAQQTGTKANPGAPKSGDVKAKADPPKPDTGTAQKPEPSKPSAPTPMELNQKAKGLLDQNRFEEGITLLKQAIALDKNNIQSHLYLAFAYTNIKHFNQAVDEYRTVVGLSPREADFQFGLGTALLDVEKYAEARAALERAHELNPGDVRYRIAIGNAYMREKDYHSAYDAYLKALGYAPDSPLVHALLGDVEEQLNRHADALSEYDATLRLDPKNQSAILGRATALAGLKRFDEAEKIMRDLVARSPKEAATHSGLAQVLDSAGKHTEAIAEYNAALAITADDPYLWGNLGWAQFNAGMLDDSVKSSRKALTLEPKLPYVRLNLGLAFAVRDRWNEAQKEYEQAVAISAAADLHGGINDVRDALAKGKPNNALRKALDLLTTSEWKAIGLPEDGTAGAHRPTKTQ